jgi:2-keto-3-deoxy-6-phosphogluconate aldolase
MLEGKLTVVPSSNIADHNYLFRNQTAVDAISTVQQNLASAQDGVNTILQAIQAGQAPPSAARLQVGNGLNGAAVALLGINGTV